MPLAGEKLLGEERDQGQSEDQRKDHRDRERQAERAEEFAHYAGKQAQRREDHDRGSRRADDRPQQLSRPFFRGLFHRLAEAQVPVDVFDDHHGVVNDQPDGDGETAERHQVNRPAENAHEEKRADDGDGKRGGGNERGPALAQEEK